MAEIESLICSKHGNEIKVSNFYIASEVSTFSGLGYIPICKNCLYEMVNNYYDKYKNMKLAIYYICRKIDIAFDSTIYDAALRKGKDNAKKVFQSYMIQYNSLGQTNGAQLPFDNGEHLNENKILANSIDDSDDTKTDDYTNKDNEKIIYSRKWMGKYTKSEVEYLDNYYNELQFDFKIVTENHKDYAKKIAKASLAMDRAYGDILEGKSGADKRYRDLKDVFDSLSKSAQFAEDKRGQNDVSLGSFGVVFDKVEQRKWIPKHQAIKKDDYDKLIEYFSTIDKSI